MTLNNLVISNNILLIIPNNIKSKIIKKISNENILLNIKIMSIEEFRNKFYFDISEKAIYYLMNKYGYKYGIAKEYLNNLYYINEDNYNHEKLEFLTKLKRELIENNLLIIDELFINYIKNYRVIVYGYDYINKLQHKMFNEVKKYTEVQIVKKEQAKTKELTVYEFKTLEEEVSFVAQKIIDLIKDGANINNIFISNINNEEKEVIKRIFMFYNIPINLTSNETIYSTIIGTEFLDTLKETKNILKTINQIQEKYVSNTNENSLIFNKIVNICNKYNFEELDNTIINCIEEELKNTNTNKTNFSNAVNVIELKNNIFDENDYIFLIGFNQGVIPMLYKDEEYLNNNIKTILKLETS